MNDVPHLLVGQIRGNGTRIELLGKHAVPGGGSNHHHFLHPSKGQDGCLNAHDGVSSRLSCLLRDSPQCAVPCFIEDVRVLTDLATSQRAKRTQKAPPNPDGVGYIPKDKLDGHKACIKLAIELLAIGRSREGELFNAVAFMMNTIAGELKLDPVTARRAGLLHDIGKAVSSDVEGPHALIGGEFCRRYGEIPDVVHGVEAHHEDIEIKSVWPMLVQGADAVSAARPGARNVSVENFAERMKELENTALGFDGIEKAYAISAGREVRIFVFPQKIDDLQAIKLARDVATKIESTMQYPGTIKVNVIRETRAIEFAK